MTLGPPWAAWGPRPGHRPTAAVVFGGGGGGRGQEGYSYSGAVAWIRGRGGRSIKKMGVRVR